MDFHFKIRLLGYYNFPNQTMKPEEAYIEEAEALAPLLLTSLNSILSNPQADEFIKEAILGQAVFIFKDKKNKLYAFFTGTKIARITNVFFSKNAIKQVPLKYKRWFFPGENIVLIEDDFVAKEETQEIPINNNKPINTPVEGGGSFNWDKYDF